MLELFVWLFLVTIIYTYIGYPLLMWLLGSVWPRPVHKDTHHPSVAVVIAVYNEEKNIETRIRNCLALEYPADKREILIGSDGSNDATAAVVQKYVSQGVRFFHFADRRGKPSVLNDLVRMTQAEVLVFTDARQRFDTMALQHLVDNFADPQVGCVSGELMLEDAAGSSVGAGLGLYWNYEKAIRKHESAWYSMIGATGAIYAIRSRLYTPVPVDTLLDDVYQPVQVVRQGYRAVFDPTAKAYDRIAQSSQEESRRKVRTLAGNWQLCARLPGLLNPLGGTMAFQFLSHKVGRIVMPFALIGLLVGSALLSAQMWYRVLLIAQGMFYGLALLRAVVPIRVSLLTVPFMFCSLNLDAVRGLFAWLNGTQKITWAKK